MSKSVLLIAIFFVCGWSAQDGNAQQMVVTGNDLAIESEIARETAGAPPVQEQQIDSDDKVSPKTGFHVADANSDGKIIAREWRTYLEEHIGGQGVPYQKLFDWLDKDKNESVSEAEFDRQIESITDLMDAEFFSGQPAIDDPGVGYKVGPDSNGTSNDTNIVGAAYHRYTDLLQSHPQKWAKVNLAKLPSTAPPKIRERLSSTTDITKFDYANVVKATGIIVGGGSDFFTAGAVFITADGLAITNYHVIESMGYEKQMAIMTSDGKAHRIINVIAGNRATDVALIQVEGNNFTHVNIVSEVPPISEELMMVHHSENRFFTFDNGYLMRYPIVAGNPWMEVSMDFAPGGSGCGIFNRQGQLVGLVSTIMRGDGPTLSHGLSEAPNPSAQAMEQDGRNGQLGGAIAFLLVKHAVSPHSIFSLLNGEDSKNKAANR